ncbi:MAG TPA: HYR domain-containing protein, partial [Flavobacteriales bacterium]|nr:HYR domain-containing protein [Flavobacteriales bacterium]
MAYDLTVNRYGNVLMCAQFQRDTQFSDGTTIGTALGGGYKADVLVARFTSYGQMDWVLTATGDDDDAPLAIAADNSGGIYTGGQFKSGLTFSGVAALSTSNVGYFQTKITDSSPSYWPGNPTSWFPTSPVCAASAAWDLNSTLPAFSREYVDAVVSSSNVTNPNNIIGAPTGTVATFAANGATITADLTVTIPAGNTFVITWGKSAAVGGASSFQLESSMDNVNWVTLTAPTTTSTSATLRNSVVQATADLRYLRITMNTSISAINFKVDAIRFFTGALQGGTWSGGAYVTSTGIFTPTGLNGSYPVSYTVTNGTCVWSTTKNILVDPISIGGTLSYSPVCPGGTSTLNLTGSVGNSTNWVASSDGTNWNTIANNVLTTSIANITTPLQVVVRVTSGTCPSVMSNMLTVTPTDNVAPTIVCGSAPGLFAGANCQAALPNWTALATTSDNCSGAVQVTQSPSAGTFVSNGTAVTLTATDASGNSSSCVITAVVQDLTPPVLSCPPPLIVLYTPSNSCEVAYPKPSISYTDNCLGTGIITPAIPIGIISVSASGTILDVDDMNAGTLLLSPGMYHMTDTTRDASGNFSVCNWVVEVRDTISPTIDCASAISVNYGANACGADVSINLSNALISDNCPTLPGSLTADHTSGLWMPDTVTVRFWAQDAFGNSSTCLQQVIVLDDTPPTILCPGDHDLAMDAGTCVATVPVLQPPMSISDNCGVVTWMQTGGPIAGETVSVGTHTVTYKATDASGLSNSCTFDLVLQNDVAPGIICQTDTTVVAQNWPACGQDVSWPVPVVIDPCGSTTLLQTIGPVNGDFLPMDQYTVGYETTSTNGQSANCSFQINVVDGSEPQVVCPLWDGYPVYLPADCNLSFPDLRLLVTVYDCTGSTNDMWPPVGMTFSTDTVVSMTMDVDDPLGYHTDNDHTIHITDTIPPTFTPLADMTVAMDGNGDSFLPDLNTSYGSASDCTLPIAISQNVVANTPITAPTWLLVTLADA